MSDVLEPFINKHYASQKHGNFKIYRLYDSSNFGPAKRNNINPCDYFGYINNEIILIECKETVEDKIKISVLRKKQNQIDALQDVKFGLYICLLKKTHQVVLIDAKHLPMEGSIKAHMDNSKTVLFTNLLNLPKIIKEYYGLEK